MSTSNYLNTLRKSDLVEFAELSDLQEYVRRPSCLCRNASVASREECK